MVKFKKKSSILVYVDTHGTELHDPLPGLYDMRKDGVGYWTIGQVDKVNFEEKKVKYAYLIKIHNSNIRPNPIMKCNVVYILPDQTEDDSRLREKTPENMILCRLDKHLIEKEIPDAVFREKYLILQKIILENAYINEFKEIINRISTLPVDYPKMSEKDMILNVAKGVAPQDDKYDLLVFLLRKFKLNNNNVKIMACYDNENRNLAHIFAMSNSSELIRKVHRDEEMVEDEEDLLAFWKGEDVYKRTPLHYAVEYHYHEVLNAYLDSLGALPASLMNRLSLIINNLFETKDDRGLTIKSLLEMKKNNSTEHENTSSVLNELINNISENKSKLCMKNLFSEDSTEDMTTESYRSFLDESGEIDCIKILALADMLNLKEHVSRKILYTSVKNGFINKTKLLWLSGMAGTPIEKNAETSWGLVETAAVGSYSQIIDIKHKKDEEVERQLLLLEDLILALSMKWDGSGDVTDLIDNSVSLQDKFTYLCFIDEKCKLRDRGQPQMLKFLLDEHGLEPPSVSFVLEYCDFTMCKILLKRFLSKQRTRSSKEVGEEFLKDICMLTSRGLEMKCLLLLKWLVEELEVDILLKNLRDTDPAFHIALRNNHFLCAKYLLHLNPDMIFIPARNGMLPINIAIEAALSINYGDFDTASTIYFLMDLYKAESGYLINIWDLLDAKGRNVRSFALQCRNNSIKILAKRRDQEALYHTLITMVENNANCLSFYDVCRKNGDLFYFESDMILDKSSKPKSHFGSKNEQIFLFSAIMHDRDDVLEWYLSKVPSLKNIWEWRFDDSSLAPRDAKTKHIELKSSGYGIYHKKDNLTLPFFLESIDKLYLAGKSVKLNDDDNDYSFFKELPSSVVSSCVKVFDISKGHDLRNVSRWISEKEQEFDVANRFNEFKATTLPNLERGFRDALFNGEPVHKLMDMLEAAKQRIKINMHRFNDLQRCELDTILDRNSFYICRESLLYEWNSYLLTTMIICGHQEIVAWILDIAWKGVEEKRLEESNFFIIIQKSLYTAVKYGSVVVIDTLVKKFRANVNHSYQDEDMERPRSFLFIAATYLELDSFQYLLKSMKSNKLSEISCELAVSVCRFQAMDLAGCYGTLLDTYFPNDQILENIILDAVHKIKEKKKANRLKLLDFLIKKGFSYNINLLHIALQTNCKEMFDESFESHHTYLYEISLPITIIEFLVNDLSLDILEIDEAVYGDDPLISALRTRKQRDFQFCAAVETGSSIASLQALATELDLLPEFVKDRKGTHVLYLAAQKDFEHIVRWLIQERKADHTKLDSEGNNILYDICKQYNSNKVLMDLEVIDSKNIIRFKKAILIQKNWRGKVARKKYKDLILTLEALAQSMEKTRDEYVYGKWKQVIFLIYDLEVSVHKKKQTFENISWAQILTNLSMVVQNETVAEADDELSLMRKHLLEDEDYLNLEEDEEQEFEPVDSNDVFTRATSLAGKAELNVVVKTEKLSDYKFSDILLSDATLKWLNKMKADVRLINIFEERIKKISEGDRSYCMSKALKGFSQKDGFLLFETKLTRGDRILWTEKYSNGLPAILVWYVSTHEKVSHYVRLIEESFRRRIVPSHEEEESKGEGKINVFDEEDDELMLVDPLSNNLLKTYDLKIHDLPKLKTEWSPMIKLTERETKIVNNTGSVLLLGRSGTGKTLCLLQRILNDFKSYTSLGSPLKQIFVAFTQQLCTHVGTMYRKVHEQHGSSDAEGSIPVSIKFFRMTNLLKILFNNHLKEDDEDDFDTKWPPSNKVTFPVFRDEIWKSIVSNVESKVHDPLTIWTQIRSFLKGSIEAAQSRKADGSYLKPDLYINGKEFSESRVHLVEGERRFVMSCFLRYQAHLDKLKLWDENDVCLEILVRLMAKVHNLSAEPIYNRIYVDEVQDLTQAEIGVLLLAAGTQSDSIFFCGDTAQSVSYGVQFRFEEIRSCIHKLTDGRRALGKVERLTRTLRSHDGILRVCNSILDALVKAFPKGNDNSQADIGIAKGPSPGLIVDIEDSVVVALCEKYPKLHLITWDDNVDTLRKRLNNEKILVYGVRNIKGMEYDEVAVIDFFRCRGIPEEKQQVHKNLHADWKSLLLGGKKKKLDIRSEIELQLKVLYTAASRACSRLLFIETQSSVAGDAFFKFLNTAGMGKPFNVSRSLDSLGLSGFSVSMMLPDDWLIKGSELAALAEDSEDYDVAISNYTRAIQCFGFAGDENLKDRAKRYLTALDLHHVKLKALAKDSEKVVNDGDAGLINYEIEKAASDATLNYLLINNFTAAASLCDKYCSAFRDEGGFSLRKLGKRIKNLNLNRQQ